MDEELDSLDLDRIIYAISNYILERTADYSRDRNRNCLDDIKIYSELIEKIERIRGY